MANLTPQQFAASLLKTLGIRQTPGAMKALVGWEQAEGGNWHNQARFNPLNTTQPEPGAGNTGSQGNIKVYQDWQQGLQATAQTLRNGRYGPILQALKAGNPQAVADAIGNSRWGTGSSLVHQTIGAASPASANAPVTASTDGSSSTSTTSTVGGVNHSKARGALIASFLEGADPRLTQGTAAAGQQTTDPLSLVAALKGLADVPGRQVTTTTRTPSAPPSSNTPPSSSGGLASFDGKQVAGWIAPILQRARATGLWHGTVNSGYRSDAQQKAIYDSGVRPAAVPKSEGGSGSNHEGANFPYGAVDVSDAAGLAAALNKLGLSRRLVYAGAKDPVHFSHPHNGGY